MTASDYRFEIAISFAGDNKRAFVRAVAECLQNKLGKGKVFFDEWYEEELAGHDAQVVLQNYYGKMTRLVVTCVCQRYNEKPWTQDEWRAIQAFERGLRDAGTSNVRRMRFLPLRFGDGEIDGLFSTAIVPDVRNRTPEAIADLILKRLDRAKQVGTQNDIDQLAPTEDDGSDSVVRLRDRIDKLQLLKSLHSWSSSPWFASAFLTVWLFLFGYGILGTIFNVLWKFVGTRFEWIPFAITLSVAGFVGQWYFRKVSSERKKSIAATLESLQEECPDDLAKWGGVGKLSDVPTIEFILLQEVAKIVKSKYRGYGGVGLPYAYYGWDRPEARSLPIAVKTWASILGALLGSMLLCGLVAGIAWLLPVAVPILGASIMFSILWLLYAVNVHFDEYQNKAHRPYTLKTCFLFGLRQGPELVLFLLVSVVLFGIIGGCIVAFQYLVEH